jgi:hypothetical protein
MRRLAALFLVVAAAFAACSMPAIKPPALGATVDQVAVVRIR